MNSISLLPLRFKIHNMVRIAVAGTRGFPGLQGGVENHCEQLYTRLAREGWDITVFTRTPYAGRDPQRYKGVSLVPVGCPKNKYLEAIVHVFLCILKARTLRHDILHLHAIGPSFFAPMALLLGMKVVVTHHGPDYQRKKWPSFARLFLRLCERIGMRFADEVIAITPTIMDEIRRKSGRHAVVIPNGVIVPKPAETDEVLERFELQKGRYVLAVGRLVPEKGFHDLIDAYAGGRFGDWKLVIVGSADHEDRYSLDLQEQANRHPGVILTGFLSGQPLHEIYSHAGLFILPSYHEGLSIVLLEAMSYGISCLASDIPANRNVELEEDRFFPAGDVQALTTKIRDYLHRPFEDPQRKAQIERIAGRYDWDTIARQTGQVYRRLVS